VTSTSNKVRNYRSDCGLQILENHILSNRLNTTELTLGAAPRESLPLDSWNERLYFQNINTSSIQAATAYMLQNRKPYGTISTGSSSNPSSNIDLCVGIMHVVSGAALMPREYSLQNVGAPSADPPDVERSNSERVPVTRTVLIVFGALTAAILFGTIAAIMYLRASRAAQVCCFSSAMLLSYCGPTLSVTLVVCTSRNISSSKFE
jgi:hypothetical protein